MKKVGSWSRSSLSRSRSVSRSTCTNCSCPRRRRILQGSVGSQEVSEIPKPKLLCPWFPWNWTAPTSCCLYRCRHPSCSRKNQEVFRSFYAWEMTNWILHSICPLPPSAMFTVSDDVTCSRCPFPRCCPLHSFSTFHKMRQLKFLSTLRKMIVGKLTCRFNIFFSEKFQVLSLNSS